MRKNIKNLMCEDFDNLIYLDDDLSDAVKQVMCERKKYLDMHKETIYPDRHKNLVCTKLGGKVVSAKTQEKLNAKIINYYKSLELTFEVVMLRELKKKLELKSIIKSSYDRYIIDYERYVKNSALDKKTVSQVNESDIRKFLEKILKAGISKKNFSNLCGLLNIVYFYSDENNIDVSNVKKKMQISNKQYNKSNKRQSAETVWSEEEELLLEAYCQLHSDNLKALGILFMLRTGIAISELVALQLRDIDLEAKEYHISRIERKYKNDEGKTVYEITEDETAKTETRLETAYLDETAIRVYKQILSQSTAKKPTDFIFAGLHSYSFNDYLRRHIIPDLHLEPRGLHSFRKSYATDLIDSDIALSIVQLQMRHANIETTMKHYYKRKKAKADILASLNARKAS